MGLLRKLAGLVVEFPEEEEQKAQATGVAGDDVVAAIERIRLDLESGGHTDFSKTVDTPSTAASKPDQQPGPPAGQSPAMGSKATGPDEGIMLPRVLSVPEVYDQAGLPMAQEFSIYRVEEMLNDPEITDLAIEMRARMVRLTLKTMGKDLNDILKDAGLRDKAIEDYQAFLATKVGEVESQVKRVNAAVQDGIDEFVRARTAVIEGNNAKLIKVREQQAEFVRSQEAEEQRLFDIATPFVGSGQNPVDV